MKSLLSLLMFAAASLAWLPDADAQTRLRAGVAVVDISPQRFPAVVSGGFFERMADKLQDPLHARALVLDDGATRLALVVVDNLMMSRELLDEAKRQASLATGIREDRMMISATHTHCAPSVMGALGTGVDEDYAGRLPGWIVQAITRAASSLQPARAGWAVVDDPQHTHCRRWIHRPDKIDLDPFGDRTVRAMMHPGYQNPDYIGPAGPVDTQLSLLSLQSPGGRPIAVLANYSMHYFGSKPVSADYYGLFCDKLAKKIGGKSGDCPVVILSQGTSGDLHWMDYSRPKTNINMDTYADEVAQRAMDAYSHVRYRDATLAMAERKLVLGRRAPDERRLAWARQTIAQMGPRKAKTRTELYATEAIMLHHQPRRELKLQAIRIGELGITAIPDEVFGITGLKLKAQSPLVPTFNIELANGGEGYIPPPSQHKLGGYTTWPARTAGLEVPAEPQIVGTLLDLLEEVSGHARRKPVAEKSACATAVLVRKPAGYWRLEDFEGPDVADSSGAGRTARFQGGVAYYLEGHDPTSRAVHLAGGWLECPADALTGDWTAELWFWNGLPANLRPLTGCILSRGPEQVTIDGAGKLTFTAGQTKLAAQRPLEPNRWYHLALVRTSTQISIYLDGRAAIEGPAPAPSAGPLLVGSCGQADSTFEGKIDEVALYARALRGDEVTGH